jgi:hypothetical protein
MVRHLAHAEIWSNNGSQGYLKGIQGAIRSLYVNELPPPQTLSRQQRRNDIALADTRGGLMVRSVQRRPLGGCRPYE